MEKNSHGSNMSYIFNQLMENYGLLRQDLKEMDRHSRNIRMLSFNSSIEAAHVGAVGAGFRVIANEIKRFSEISDKTNEKCGEVVDSIERQMRELIGVRTADIAFDVIDKIDRNLFERFCDVQAWATFGKIVSCLENPDEKSVAAAGRTISNLVKIYEVYHEIILADASGRIVVAGVDPSLTGTDAGEMEWFKKSVSGEVFVSDMYFSRQLDRNTISYSCPVRNSSGKILGVISTRFNWDFICDIVDKAKIGADSGIYVVNVRGEVIASKTRTDVLRMNLSSSDAFAEISAGTGYGYITGKSPSGKLRVCGFAKTSGYNSYSGKGWSVIVEEEY